MLLWIRKPEASSMTAYLPCSLLVYVGRTSCLEWISLIQKKIAPQYVLFFFPCWLFFHAFSHRGIGKQCNGSTYPVGAWPSYGFRCPHHYPDPSASAACSMCQVIQHSIAFHSSFTTCWFKIVNSNDGLSRHSAKKGHLYIILAYRLSVFPGCAAMERLFIFTTQQTTPEFTTKRSSRVLK